MVSLAIIPQPIVRVLPIKYPASEIYLSRPLGTGAGVPEAVHVVEEVILEGMQKPKRRSRGNGPTLYTVVSMRTRLPYIRPRRVPTRLHDLWRP